MRKLLSTKYSAGAFNAAMLFLRLLSGILILKAGYYKLTHFSEIQPKFMNWLGIGSTASLSLVIFAEFFCAIFIILGLFTRLAAIPLIIVMCVLVFQLEKGNIFEAQSATLFLAAYLTLLLVGPGKISVDHLISK